LRRNRRPQGGWPLASGIFPRRRPPRHPFTARQPPGFAPAVLRANSGGAARIAGEQGGRKRALENRRGGGYNKGILPALAGATPPH